MTPGALFVGTCIAAGAVLGACWVGIRAATRALYDN